MKNYKTTYKLNDNLFIKRDDSCDEGVVEAITLTVTPTNRVTEEYHIRCTDQLSVSDITHVGRSKEEIIEKLISVQVDSLLPKHIRILRDMVADILTASVENRKDRDKIITMFPRLHKRGFVVSDDEITLVNFTKVVYTKTEDGVEVKFYHDNSYESKEGFVTEAYANIQEATTRLRRSFQYKLEHNCSM